MPRRVRRNHTRRKRHILPLICHYFLSEYKCCPSLVSLTFPACPVKKKLKNRTLQILACQHLVSLKVFVNGLLHDVLRQLPAFFRVGFQPVTGELFVKGRLAMSGLVDRLPARNGSCRESILHPPVPCCRSHPVRTRTWYLR